MSREGKKHVKEAVLSCAGSLSSGSLAQLPRVRVYRGGKELIALLDTGCSKSIVAGKLVSPEEVRPFHCRVVMMDGKDTVCSTACTLSMEVEGVVLKVDCVVGEILPPYDMLLGMDFVKLMGGVFVDGSGNIEFGTRGNNSRLVVACAEEGEIQEVINDDDFSAVFKHGKWVVEWKWNGNTGPVLRNLVGQYKVAREAEGAFHEEVEEWIRNGWLERYGGEYDGVIPLMAVIQANKSKVRPVLDFRELNEYVSSHTGASDVCAEKLRLWRKKGKNIKIVDLRKAYLQIHVGSHLWKYQVVRYKGETYCLTRLGFGLNVAPKIMTAIVNFVLSKDPRIRVGTDSYIDDIYVDESVVPGDAVIAHLERFGLRSKPAEPLIGGRVLGLRILEKNGDVIWTRDNKIETLGPSTTKRQAFSLCGQLVGHFPVVGWLRPASSFVKRSLSELGWDEVIGTRARSMLEEVTLRVAACDPVRGIWVVPSGEAGVVWCDASTLAIGVVIEKEDIVIEDASWLRKPNDSAHINLAELEAVLKGVNLALKWDFKSLQINTDSATVYSWVSSMVSKDRRIKTHGLGEALVRRRLALLDSIITEYSLRVVVNLVRSENNKADPLTRVPKQWLQKMGDNTCAVAVEPDAKVAIITASHAKHHFGVDRSLFIVRQCYPDLDISREEVEGIVRRCRPCLSIDPAPIRWEAGELSCDRVWHRVAMDVTHYGQRKFLTLIDCGPSRFSVWRVIGDEGIEQVIKVLSEVFCDRGPPAELLTDNSRTFRSQELGQFFDKWGVTVLFRCVYRASGNGIVERNHRTIKRMAERSGGSIRDMVFWYNFSPRDAGVLESSPASLLSSYTWRCPGQPKVQRDIRDTPGFQVGEAVFVRPDGARCTTRWREGRVTSTSNERSSGIGVEVNGMPYHTGDIRRMGPVVEEVESEVEEQREIVEEGRPTRNRTRPAYLADYDCGDLEITGACGLCADQVEVGGVEAVDSSRQARLVERGQIE